MSRGPDQEPWRYGATELARFIRQRDMSSREVVESHLRRIEAVNGPVNAVTAVLADSALAAADLADATSPEGPLHGVPFTIKENIDCTGSPTTNGVPALAGAMPPQDAPVVARLKMAGAIPLARTNLPEFGLRITTDNPLRGRTNNPFDPARTAGGSSGGEGAAIATGMSPLGLGNDIGGSLRNPAFCCGIASLKPTTGRIPHATSIPPLDDGLAGQLMAVEGPMAREVADLDLAWRLLSGHDPRDPVSITAPLDGPDVPLRATLVTEVPGVTLPPAFVTAIRTAGAALADAGWQVEEALPPDLAAITELWGQILAMDFETSIPLLRPVMSPAPVHLLELIVARYKPAATTLSDVHVERARLRREWSAYLATSPLIVGPVWTDVQFLHDADLEGVAGLELTIDRLRFITPGNALGIPAVALTTGRSDGLPVAVQLYADSWREDVALGAARTIEAALGRIAPVDPAP